VSLLPRSDLMRQISIVACLAGLAVATVFFIATWNRSPTPQWMPMIIAMVGGYELVQWGQGLWDRRQVKRNRGR
jgi:xanthosine utilization system XapX-like protein